MPQESEELRFPDITPAHIVRGKFHVIEEDDIRSEEDLQRLLRLMYEQPEHAFYLYAAKDRGINNQIASAERFGLVRYLIEDFFYFRHPKYKQDYVQILEHQIQWDWERDVIAKDPMFVRVTLGLTKKSERQFEHVEIAAKQKEMFVESARLETGTESFIEWAGNERTSLAIVFTDVVDSTALGEELGDEGMNEVRRAHFAQSRKLITQHNGREIKTIGDSFMVVFHSVEDALDYAMALQVNPGHTQLQIRAGIHIGPMQVEEEDVFGRTVIFAARVVGTIHDAEIWLSAEAKIHMDGYKANRHKQLEWQQHDGLTMKGFDGAFTLWALNPQVQ